MDKNDVLTMALKLKPDERYLLVECLTKSLDEPNEKLDEIWLEEAERRLLAHRDGRSNGVPAEEIFSE